MRSCWEDSPKGARLVRLDRNEVCCIDDNDIDVALAVRFRRTDVATVVHRMFTRA